MDWADTFVWSVDVCISLVEFHIFFAYRMAVLYDAFTMRPVCIVLRRSGYDCSNIPYKIQHTKHNSYSTMLRLIHGI